jgi:4'-phosphopantetheinyl transferase
MSISVMTEIASKRDIEPLQGVFLESMYCCLSPAGASLLQGRREHPLQGRPQVSVSTEYPWFINRTWRFARLTPVCRKLTASSPALYPFGMTTFKTLWESPSAELALPENEVHVWRVALDPPTARIKELAQTLSADECERASRFHFEEHRGHYIVARGVLRALLARYLDKSPETLRFIYGEHGKPALDEEALCFNLSHSGTLALYALARNRTVGIDVEYMREKVAREQIAGRFFAPQEVAALKAVSAELKEAAFFKCWTRKEAYLKARGDGISVPLDSFAVGLGEETALLGCKPDPGEVARWSLQGLDPGPGYAAALCVEGNDWMPRCYQWKG